MVFQTVARADDLRHMENRGAQKLFIGTKDLDSQGILGTLTDQHVEAQVCMDIFAQRGNLFLHPFIILLHAIDLRFCGLCGGYLRHPALKHLTELKNFLHLVFRDRKDRGDSLEIVIQPGALNEGAFAVTGNDQTFPRQLLNGLPDRSKSCIN